MSLTTGEMSAADLAAVVGNNDGAFGGNNGSWWIILLFLVLFNGGYNNGFGGGNAGGNGFVPYYLANNTDNGVQAGFNNAALTSQLAGIQNAITSGFSSAEIAGCNRAMADMERSFATQTALTGGLTNISAQLAQCCCDNRLATAQTQALVLSENCADRQALSDGIRSIIESQTASTQKILDQMCNDKIDAKNERIADLERQLTMANLAASQTAQTAQILANNEAQTTALERYLAPNPVPAYIVQNPNCCTNTGCGCGM